MTEPLSCLPDERQSFLLRACLSEKEDARAAYERWVDGIDFDALDAGSVRLMPILSSRLGELGIADEHSGRIRGLARQAWVQNQLLFNAVRPAIEAMGTAGIDVLVLKGAGLASKVYPQFSMRPMLDIDIMVAPEDVGKAAEILEGMGWAPAFPPPGDAADFAYQHALPLSATGADSIELDLHWRLLSWKKAPAGEARMWSHAEPLPALGSNALMPCATDLLLHVCAHGIRWNRMPPIRWIADAIMILRHRTIDWTYFMIQCEAFGLSLPLRNALAFLADSYGADIPANVLESLKQARARTVDRMIFTQDQIPPDERPFLEYCFLHIHRASTMVGRSPAALFSYFNRHRRDRSKRETLSWLWRRVKQ